jgi:hypothetical protein
MILIMKSFCNILLLLICLFTFSHSYSQKFPELDLSPHDISYFRGKDKMPLIKVLYGRPQKKGRKIFGELEPYGKVWRTGANESTEIKFYKDVKIDGKDIKAGTYSLFTIPDKDHWTIILNTSLDQWGAYSYDEKADVLRSQVKVQTLPLVAEVLSIAFKDQEQGALLIIAWDKTLVELPIIIAQ